jgi:hypothetical protein
MKHFYNIDGDIACLGNVGKESITLHSGIFAAVKNINLTHCWLACELQKVRKVK